MSQTMELSKLVEPEIVSCYFEEGFQPHLSAMYLNWRGDAAALHPRLWLLPNGLTLTGPAPLRFGLLTMDITRWAFGINPYLQFFRQEPPDWEPALREKRGVGLIVAPMPAGTRDPRVHIDHRGLQEDLKSRGLQILDYHPLPHGRMPFFAAAFVRGEARQMDAYLRADFGRFVKGPSAPAAGRSGRSVPSRGV